MILVSLIQWRYSLHMKRMTITYHCYLPLSPRSVFFVPLSTHWHFTYPTLTLVPPMCYPPKSCMLSSFFCFHFNDKIAYVEAQMLLIPPLIMHVGEFWGKTAQVRYLIGSWWSLAAGCSLLERDFKISHQSPVANMRCSRSGIPNTLHIYIATLDKPKSASTPTSLTNTFALYFALFKRVLGVL